MSNEFKYDVFLSHADHDKPVVRELAERLKPMAFSLSMSGSSSPETPSDQRCRKRLESSRVLVLCMPSMS